MTSLSLALRGRRALGAALISASLMAACGGSTSQVEKFVPARLLSFGDELNYLTDDGHKYSVNALSTTDKSLACDLAPLWVQYLATTQYAKVFGQCPGTGTDPSAFRLSTASARVDDLVTQVSGYIAGSGFQNTDLVTILVGMHDVLDAYNQYNGGNEADLETQLNAKGELLGNQVKRIVGSGARVIISTVPDLGLTPFALAEKANKGDDRPTVLTNLTEAFNKSMRLSLSDQSGATVGLVIADDLTRSMVRVPSAYGLVDVTQAVCTVALPNCTTDTVITAAVDKSSTFMWADDLHPGATFHLQMGLSAVRLVNTLPF
jgi:outer membrane lipase/esterase